MSDRPEWEEVLGSTYTPASQRGDFTERLRVPGGWLYRTIIHSNDNVAGTDDTGPIAVSMVFVPDPERG